MLFAVFLVLLPMILLALGITILDEHTCLAHLETNASLFTAIGTAGVNLVHPGLSEPRDDAQDSRSIISV
jgi:hypothetical protein